MHHFVRSSSLSKMLITLENILLYFTLKHFLDNGMQNGYEASPSIGVAGHGW